MITTRWQQFSPFVKGVIALLISTLGFTLMGLFVKLAGDVPLAEKSIFRNAVTALISGYFVWRSGLSFCGKAHNRGLLVVRSITGLIGIVCTVYAIDHLVLSDADMLGKLTSFIFIALSAILLKECASPLQWSMCALAFIGALFIIKPSFDIRFIPYAVGVIASIFAALAYICLRLLASPQRAEAPNTIIFFFSAFSTLVLLPFLWFDFQPLNWAQFGYLTLSGLMATLGQFGVTFAYKYAAAKEISIYSYSSVLFSALLSMLIFNDFPDQWSLLGYAVIFTSGWVMFMYGKRRR